MEWLAEEGRLRDLQGKQRGGTVGKILQTHALMMVQARLSDRNVLPCLLYIIIQAFLTVHTLLIAKKADKMETWKHPETLSRLLSQAT